MGRIEWVLVMEIRTKRMKRINKRKKEKRKRRRMEMKIQRQGKREGGNMVKMEHSYR